MERRVGIITFHCSDNYGAMLQAYGLKKYLNKKDILAEIVRYEPFYMTGRHWWIPYIPIKGVAGCVWLGLKRWKNHLRMGKEFFELRANMKSFRKRYLCEEGRRKMFFAFQLQALTYPYYIVGSDQIWNPDITCGLRKVYFGGFKNKRKERVIAYAASLGGGKLDAKYDRGFSELLRFVDSISLREKEAVSYVNTFYQKDIPVVVDPVLLLDQESWESVEKEPEQKGYILVYVTEKNREMIDYVKKISEEKALSVVELRADKEKDPDFYVDYTAGPAEFLGYIHKADYVVTNSFHGVVFSIIYQKKFLVFQHSSYHARIENILQICGLEGRVYRRDTAEEIDAYIEWDEVKKKMDGKVCSSKEYLRKQILNDSNLP